MKKNSASRSFSVFQLNYRSGVFVFPGFSILAFLTFISFLIPIAAWGLPQSIPSLSGNAEFDRSSPSHLKVVPQGPELKLAYDFSDFKSDETLEIESSPDATVQIVVPEDLSAVIAGKIVSKGPLEIVGGKQLTFVSSSNMDSPSLNIKAEEIKSKGRMESSGGDIHLNAKSVILDGGEITVANAVGSAGRIRVTGHDWVSVGGTLNAKGKTGGDVRIKAGSLSLASPIVATGSQGLGGTVEIHSAKKSWETATGSIDVSGSEGGTIRHLGGGKITTSSNYIAKGVTGKGGHIDVTALTLKFLSGELNASGWSGGGQVRLGGEYQGGKGMVVDELANSESLEMTDGTRVLANTLGPDGPGGTVIAWSDTRSVILGKLSARPGYESGAGGLIETSSQGKLTFAGLSQAGYGDRKGKILLDPHNATIEDLGSVSQSAIILGKGYNSGNIQQDLFGDDAFGSSVSLDGTRLAVGAPTDDRSGVDGGTSNEGVVYLYTFTNGLFGGGALQGIIGEDFVGGNNIDVTLFDGDFFGSSVSLSGTRLAVGATQDDGSGTDGTSNEGAVYLFTFTDMSFTTGSHVGTIGEGYAGGKDLSISLDGTDNLGTSVSLDGNRLAIGAQFDDNSTNTGNNTGAVYLVSFTDSVFSGPTLEATLGASYAGPKDLSLPLDNIDNFGRSVSLDGNRLAVGALRDGGLNDDGIYGAVYLFSFTDSVFSGPSQEAIIGNGYSGTNDFNQALTTGDFFGTSVSLDGNRLAIGAVGDDGDSDSVSGSGAVYLFTFTGSSDFSGLSLQGTMGAGYTGGKNIDVTLGADRFGKDVSLDGERLVIGSPDDDGLTDSGDVDDSGAVYLFCFDDLEFTNGALQLIIGAEYEGGKNVDVALDASGEFGSGVSLSGNGLAVGNRHDDNATNSGTDTGSVFLYSFTNEKFGFPTLEGTIGEGYTGGKNLDMANFLDNTDDFGASVSLDGTQLAVGAPGDDISIDEGNNDGAVYLFTFADTSFTTPTLQAIVGSGYTGNGGKDINIETEIGEADEFGSAVSLDSNRLAVGAPNDDGTSGAIGDNEGAVYLFTFTDGLFSGGVHVGTIGSGYNGAKDINETNIGLDETFGTSVSLQNQILVVGAQEDSGSGGGCASCGAVFMYSFTDTAFSGGNLEGIIGDGYNSRTKDIDFTLDTADLFGSGVSLDDQNLAVGAKFSDGLSNGCSMCGDVYVFSFTDNLFSGGTLEAEVGSGFTGTKDINQSLGTTPLFGTSVSLNSNRLAVGAPDNDDENGTNSNAGAVYLYTFDDDDLNFGGNNIEEALYAISSHADFSLYNLALAAMLANGDDVTIQANNDLTVSAPITVDNPSGNGGSLTLQAGRSVFLNANITTDNGNLTVIGNDLLSNGVVDSQRDSGNAELTMSAAASFNSGTGTLTLDLRSGVGKTNSGCGDLTAEAITAGPVNLNSDCNTGNLLVNKAITGTTIGIRSDNDITFASAGDVTGTGTIIVTADNDINPDAGTGGSITMDSDTIIDGGSALVSLSSDEDLTLGQLVTTSTLVPAINVFSISGNVFDAGTTETNITATNGGLTVITGTDFGASGNFIEGQVNSLSFAGVSGSDFFTNAGTTVAFDATVSNNGESTTAVNIPVSLSQVNGTTTVNYSVTGGTATGSGTDFTLTDGMLTFAPGTTTQNIAVTVVNDILIEADETIEITLSSPSSNASLGTNTVHTYTINNDETTTVAFGASSSNGNESSTTVNIPVSLTQASGSTITVGYSVTGGTATGSGTDFTLADGTLTFVPTDVTEDIVLTIINDTLDESDETIIVTLINPTNTSLGTITVHTYTIVDNDGVPTVSFDSPTSSGPETSTTVALPVSLSNPSASTVSVDFNLTGGTASNVAQDFSLGGDTLSFNPGETAKTIDIPLTDDTLDEIDETIEVTLSNPTNATLGINPVHTYTIIDDEFADTPDSLRIFSPYWQAGTFTYSFIGVSHPSLSGMSSQVGLQVLARSQDSQLADSPLEFTIHSNQTQKIFIVQTNNPFINPTFIKDGLFILSTDATSFTFGNLEFKPIATRPLSIMGEGVPGEGYPDITMLSFWGAVVVRETSTGFSMQFIGDVQDSKAFKTPYFSGVN